VGNGLLARLPRGRVPQVGRSDGWLPKLLRELDRIPPTGRLTVTGTQGITKAGDAALRQALYLAADAARHIEPTLAQRYYRLGWR
jgi:hypothetical protein